MTKEDRERTDAMAGGTDLGDHRPSAGRCARPRRAGRCGRRGGRPTLTQARSPSPAAQLISEALHRSPTNPELRDCILDVRKSYDQAIDEASMDTVVYAGILTAKAARAAAIVTSFRQFIEEQQGRHPSSAGSLQPPVQGAADLQRDQGAGQRDGTATAAVDARSAVACIRDARSKSKVHGSGQRMLTDIVSLVGFALDQDDELVPFHDKVDERFEAWLAAEASGRRRSMRSRAMAGLDERSHRRRYGDRCRCVRVAAIH